MIASGLYITIFLDVSHQFVRNWNGKMIAYDVQNAGRVSMEVLNTNKSTKTAIANAAIAISE
jgi:hypothetical protein